MKLNLSNLGLKNTLITAILCLAVFSFIAKSVYAALTLNASTIVSDGNLILSPVGNVGIGTASPAALLTIQGPGNGTATELRLGKTTNPSAGNRLTSKLAFYDFTDALEMASIVADPDGNTSFALSLNTGFPVVERVRISAVGNVGIATTSPAFQLDIGNGAFLDGRIRLNGSQPLIEIKDTDVGFAQTWDFQATQGRLRIINGSTLALSILPSGSTGMGIILPLTKLTVGDSSSANMRGILSAQNSNDTNGARVGLAKARGTLNNGNSVPLTVASGDNLGRLSFNGYDGANYLEMGAIDVGVSGTVAATRVPTFMTFSTATNAAPSVLTERMRIDQAGNVGIGTGSATLAAKFEVDISDANTTNPFLANAQEGLRIKNTDATNNNWQEIAFDSSTGAVTSGIVSQTIDHASAFGQLGFYTRSNVNSSFAARMFITSAGNVGINTLGPAQKLDVVGAAGDTVVVRIATTSGNACTFSTVSGAFSCASDERLKRDISSISSGNALLKIGALNPVTFHYNWQNQNDPLVAGFIAQDFENVFPEMVSTDPVTGFKSLSYAPLVPYAIKAIQELNLKIDSLQLTAITGGVNSTSLFSAFLNDMFTRITAWLSDAGNGIGKIFAKEVNTENLNTKTICVSDENGAKTCINKAELDALIVGASRPAAPTPAPTPAPTLAPEPVPDPTPASEPAPVTPPADTAELIPPALPDTGTPGLPNTGLPLNKKSLFDRFFESLFSNF